MALLKENFILPYFLQFLADRQKSDILYDYDTLYKVWINQMKIGRGEDFPKIVKLEILQSALNDLKQNSRKRASKDCSHCVSIVFPSVFEIHRQTFLRGEDIQRGRRDVFGDHSTRRLPAEILRQSPAVQGASGDTHTIPGDSPCDKWSMVTATFPPLQGVRS